MNSNRFAEKLDEILSRVDWKPVFHDGVLTVDYMGRTPEGICAYRRTDSYSLSGLTRVRHEHTFLWNGKRAYLKSNHTAWEPVGFWRSLFTGKEEEKTDYSEGQWRKIALSCVETYKGEIDE